VYFDTDFESCNVGTGNDFPCEGWDDLGLEWSAVANHNTVEIATSPVFSGTKVVKGAWVNVNGGTANPSIYHSFPPTDHLFIRVATRQSPGFLIGSNNATKLIRLTAPGAYPIFTLMFYNNNFGVAIEGSYPNGTLPFVVTGVVPSQTSWDQVEMEIQLNTPGLSDGLMRVWVNGVLRIEQLNRSWRGPTPTSGAGTPTPTPSTAQFNTSQIFIQSGLGSIYYDCFAVGNTRIGPVQSRSADSTPPARPTLNPIP
jgi:hypothetical protein